MLIPLGILASAGGVAGSYELITSTILTSSASSVTFSNLGDYSSTYKHLQIRAVVRTTRADPLDFMRVRLNGATGSSYSWHYIEGSGTSVASSGAGSVANMFMGSITGNNAAANAFSPFVLDILDPYETKNKTLRQFIGTPTYPAIQIMSGAYYSTNSLTSIQFYNDYGSFSQYSRFSLFGLKG